MVAQPKHFSTKTKKIMDRDKKQEQMVISSSEDSDIGQGWLYQSIYFAHSVFSLSLIFSKIRVNFAQFYA